MEAHLNRSFVIAAELQVVIVWLEDAVEELFPAPGPHSLKLFRKPYCNGGFVWIKKKKKKMNKRGSFKRAKNTLVENYTEWEEFCKILVGYLNFEKLNI